LVCWVWVHCVPSIKLKALPSEVTIMPPGDCDTYGDPEGYDEVDDFIRKSHRKVAFSSTVPALPLHAGFRCTTEVDASVDSCIPIR
jgi:hypothetical protein